MIDRYQVVLFLHSVISKESLQSELVKDDDVFRSAQYYVVHTSKYILTSIVTDNGEKITNMRND